jgi:hypothetical protein
MRVNKLTSLLIVASSLLFACNKSEHWETDITEISNITYSSAKIVVNYDFGDKTSRKAVVGVDYGTDPQLKTNFERFQQEQNGTQSIAFEASQLYANETYFIRSYMACKKDTVWSEIMSFTTLLEPQLACSVSPNEVYYSGHDMTETVGALVKVVDTDKPDLYTLQAESSIGNLRFAFAHEPSGSRHITSDQVYTTYHTYPLVNVSFDYNVGGSTCHYEAENSESIEVTKHLNDGITISFCDLSMVKTDGDCLDKQTISGKLVN